MISDRELKMIVYRFYWRDGKISEGPGADVADAFRRLGYGSGAISDLIRHEVIEMPDSGNKTDVMENKL